LDETGFFQPEDAIPVGGGGAIDLTDRFTMKGSAALL
jgi:hypothetical protein